MPTRVVAIACSGVAVLVMAASSAALPERSVLRFQAASRSVLPGEMAYATVAVRPARARCSLSVRYADGARQRGLGAVRALHGRASWRWQVPEATAPGPARLMAVCSRAGRATRSFVVVGEIVAPRIDVVQTGFSIRPTGSGSDVSYGVILENRSATQDALNVDVLVNFVDYRNVLYGSATTRISGIGAGRKYALGNSLSFPGAAPVARLEVVVQVGARGRRSIHLPPISNVRVLPSTYEQGWVGSVEGELANDELARRLDRASLSAVVFDESGAILGGGTGGAYASLPPGARQFFKLTSGFSAIPISRASSALVSIEPTYSPVG